MYLKLVVNLFNQFFVDLDFGFGDFEMGIVVREDYDFVIFREFVWIYYSLLINVIIYMYIYRINLIYILCIY